MRQCYLLMVLMLTGCAATESSRVKSVDTLINVINRYYPFLEDTVIGDDYRNIIVKSVRESKNTRSYLVAIAKMLAMLDDRHLYFTNYEQYASTDGPIAPCYQDFFRHDGRVYLSIAKSSVAPIGSGESLPGNLNCVELVSVDGVSISAVGEQLLLAPRGTEVSLSVLDVLGHQHRFRVTVPADEDQSSMAASQPATAVPEISPAELVLIEKFFKALQFGYISIDSFSDVDEINRFHRQLDAQMDKAAMIIDLRRNGGGNLDYALTMVGRFVRRARPYGYHDYAGVRIASEPRESRRSEMRFVGPQGRIFDKPIVVMIGPRTASAAEVVAQCLRELAGAVLVGAGTAGAGAGVLPAKLEDGLQVSISLIPVRSLSGQSVQYLGLTPDIVVPLERRTVFQGLTYAEREWERNCLTKSMGVAVARAIAWGSFVGELDIEKWAADFAASTP